MKDGCSKSTVLSMVYGLCRGSSPLLHTEDVGGPSVAPAFGALTLHFNHSTCTHFNSLGKPCNMTLRPSQATLPSSSGLSAILAIFPHTRRKPAHLTPHKISINVTSCCFKIINYTEDLFKAY